LCSKKFEELERNIGYTFKDKKLLETAFIHPSYAFEKRMGRNYQLLEFLGDAVVELIVSEHLIKRFPQESEGELSQMRSFLVSERVLSALAKSCGLHSFVLLGKGEELTGGREKESILCDVFEALFGAIYLDGGYEKAKEVFEKNFLNKMWEIFENISYKDPKNQLQEISQRIFKQNPEYEVISEEGPHHKKKFTVICRVDRFSTLGTGNSKKEAERDSARKMLELLEEKGVAKG
jgi:ribonuclease-3